MCPGRRRARSPDSGRARLCARRRPRSRPSRRSSARPAPSRGGYAHEIRRVAAPERGAALGRPGGRGVEHRADELSAVGEILPVRVGHGLADARHVARVVCTHCSRSAASSLRAQQQVYWSQTPASGWLAAPPRTRWRIYVRAATACARSASGAKDAGISAATTPGSQSAIVVSTSAPPLSAVMAVSLSGATAADAVTDGRAAPRALRPD